MIKTVLCHSVRKWRVAAQQLTYDVIDDVVISDSQ